MKLNRNEFPTFFPSVNLVFREVNLENLEAHRFFAASTVRVVVVVVWSSVSMHVQNKQHLTTFV